VHSTATRHGEPEARPVARAPAALAAGGAIVAGLFGAYVSSLAGILVAAAAGSVLATAGRGSTRPGRTGAWGGACAVIGIRIVLAAGAESDLARAWAELARRGEAIPVSAVVRIDAVRPSGASGWSVRGTAISCSGPCRGVGLGWRWTGDAAPRVGSRVRLKGRILADPVRGPAGARFPPAGLTPGALRGRVVDPGVEPLGGPPVPIVASVERHLRERIEARFGASASLATALLLGDRRGVDAALIDAFAITGTLHLLAVSGLHVGFLAAALAFGLRLFGAGPAARAGVVALSLAGYAAVVGGRPSVVRATLMIGALLAARVDGRRIDPWQAWGLAALGILCVRPQEVFGLGFALSFSAVAGLLALARFLETWLVPRGSGPGVGAARLLGGGVVATTAASAGTLIVQAAAFGWVAPIGFVINPVVVPAVGAALPLAWVALLADALGLGLVAGPLADASGGALSGVAALVADTGGRFGPWAPGPVTWLAVALMTALAALAIVRRRPGGGLLLGAVSVALVFAVRPPHRAVWEITWLDVGQGDAIVIRFPDATTWLVDAGPADPFGDAGLRVVLPWLRRRGIGRIERLVTTHPDLDHVGGAASVVRGVRVETWSSGGAIATGEAYLSLLAARGRWGPPRAERLEAGDRFERAGVAIDVLHPSPGWVSRDPFAGRVNANEGSIVLLMRRGRCRALLTGDLGRPGEKALVDALGDSLRAELLHVGHHGSRHSSTAPFLARVGPRYAVASVGRTNRHGHPHPDVLGRLGVAGARIWRTDRMGEVTARCGPNGWRVSPGSP